jgi:hypothetical protein
MQSRPIILSFFLILFTSCSLLNSSSKVTNTKRPELTQINTIPITLPRTRTPTNTKIPTRSTTNTPQPTMTIPSTWTPLPTLEATAAVLYVEDLLQTNAGCKLPCWWGITPGKTTWLEANQFLESFSLLQGINGNPNDSAYASFIIPYPESMGSISHAYGIKNGIVYEILDLYNSNITINYNLVDMLNNYGQPDDILISAYYEPRHSDYMDVVAIFYLQQGILVIYYDNGGGLVGDKIQVCPQNATYPYLNLWAPSLNLSLEDAISRYLDTRNWPAYQDIQEAAGMNVESFYLTFKEPNNESCLELSPTDWPKY